MQKIPFPKAVLFDFDGVIVNSENTHMAAWASAYREIFNKKIPAFPKDSHSGKTPREIAAFFAEYGGDILKGEKLNELKQQHLVEVVPPAELLPGVCEMQNFLEENQIPYGIASNAYTDYVRKTVERRNLEFEVCMGFDMFAKPKPSPIPYLTLADHLGVSKGDYSKTLIFEDSLTGIRAAKATGMIPIGLLTQYSEKELKAHGAVKVFPTLLEAYQELTSL